MARFIPQVLADPGPGTVSHPHRVESVERMDVPAAAGGPGLAVMEALLGTAGPDRALLLWVVAAQVLLMGGVSRLPRQNLAAAGLLAGGFGLLGSLLMQRPPVPIAIQSVVLVLGVRLTARWILSRWSLSPAFGWGVALLTAILSAGLLAISPTPAGTAMPAWGWALVLGAGYLAVTPWLLDKRQGSPVADAAPVWLLVALAGGLWMVG